MARARLYCRGQDTSVAIRPEINQEIPEHLSSKLEQLLVNLGWRTVPHYNLYKVLDLAELDTLDEKSLISLLTVKETRFFRQPKQFRFLADYLNTHKNGRRKPWRIWSAACSTGEEAYSIAMVAASACKSGEFVVLASDVDSVSLSLAKRGRYKIAELADIPQKYTRFVVKDGDYFTISPKLRRYVTFFQFNLLDEPYPESDIVFMRNVLIYFKPQIVERCIEKLSRCLKPGGLVFLGEGETMVLFDRKKFFHPMPVSNTLVYVRR